MDTIFLDAKKQHITTKYIPHLPLEGNRAARSAGESSYERREMCVCSRQRTRSRTGWGLLPLSQPWMLSHSSKALFNSRLEQHPFLSPVLLYYNLLERQTDSSPTMESCFSVFVSYQTILETKTMANRYASRFIQLTSAFLWPRSREFKRSYVSKRCGKAKRVLDNVCIVLGRT